MKGFKTPEVPEIGRGVSFEELVSRCGDKRLDVVGVSAGALAPFAAFLEGSRRNRTVVIAKDAGSARQLERDLRFHAVGAREDGGVLLFPGYDQGPYDDLVPDRGSTLARAGALLELSLERWRFLVIPAEALLRRVMSRRVFEDACVSVVPGDRIDRDFTAALLERGGYNRAPLVEEPGTYALRGGIIDFFPPYLSVPVRVELFGSEVDSLRAFDPETQAGGEKLDEAWIHPVRPYLLPSDEDRRREIARRARAACDQVDMPTARTERLIDDLLDGRTFVGADGFAPAFVDGSGSLFDYLPRGVDLLVESMSAVDPLFDKILAGVALDRESRLDRGEPSFPVEDHFLTAAEISEAVAGSFVVGTHDLITEGGRGAVFGPPEEVHDLKTEGTEDLFERIRRLSGPGEMTDPVGPLVAYVRELIEEGYLVELVAHTEGQAHRLIDMLTGRGLEISSDGAPDQDRPSVSVGELARGCLLPAAGLAWITEEEVFGRRTRLARGKRRAKTTLQDLRELAPGDLVVHAEHGIGRYEGLHRQSIRGVEVDFIHIEYRDGDKLFLPVYRLDQVQKYRAAGDGEPRMDKLGGQTFSKKKAKAIKRAMEIAAKLLDLYAARKVSERNPVDSVDDLYREFEAGFPFEETDDQARAIDEVMADLEGDKPMDRLICGDVGFGKTEVAMRAAFRVVMSGRQAAVLVPTTVLAQQHYLGFVKRLAPYPVKVAMASRFRTPAQNSETILGLKEGSVDIVVGTHRLLSKDVHFKRLGLLVIDEEHRFGVTHKERIRALRSSVDTLVMTATPIPRTLHMAFSGIRDLSLIGTAPVDRRPIKTVACHDDPGLLRKAMERELARGGQVFFVHNRVRDIHKIVEYVQRLMPNAKVAVGHGQMKEDVLERVMMDFVSGAYDILVSTSIIESGLDIPRANTMIVNRADTFGLAQLYQMRGRIGRSNRQAYAYLVVPPMNALSDEARERVEALTRHTDLGSGFSLATLDLEIRGAGNLLGAEQSGDVGGVGFEMFCDLLEEASSRLRGEEPKGGVEPEVTFEEPGFLSEDYIPDVGLRLRFYKRLASAREELEVEEHVAAMVDQFGALPEEALALVDAMKAKALCRNLGVVGLEVFKKRMAVHLGSESNRSRRTRSWPSCRRGAAGSASPLISRFSRTSARAQGPEAARPLGSCEGWAPMRYKTG